MLGRGEDNSGGREKNSILACTFEGLLGAIYLDGGFAECQKLIKTLFAHRVQSLPRQTPFERDYKTRLQEAVQGKYKAAPTYQVEHTEGPDHKKVFRVGVHMGDRKLGTGVGHSRKEAEQDAARMVLTEMEL
jgi:ribonuclease-3